MYSSIIIIALAFFCLGYIYLYLFITFIRAKKNPKEHIEECEIKYEIIKDVQPKLVQIKILFSSRNKDFIQYLIDFKGYQYLNSIDYGSELKAESIDLVQFEYSSIKDLTLRDNEFLDLISNEKAKAELLIEEYKNDYSYFKELTK